MNTEFITEIIGYIACVSMVLGYLPQAVRTIRTRSTDDIAMSTFLLMAIGGLFFAIQGILVDNMPLLITNIFTTTSSAIIFGIKVYNDYFKNKKSKK
ncbi:MAG: PQ-loop domain-containing transporter [Muribaculaceae bacterium]|nr:PQ-loop domain-containing transporter [Muribaculaceae bacterium]